MPADLRVVDAYNLKVDNSSLTGACTRPTCLLVRRCALVGPAHHPLAPAHARSMHPPRRRMHA